MIRWQLPDALPTASIGSVILGTVLLASQRDCLIWPFGDKDHPVVWWNGISHTAHMIVCLLAHGEPPEGKPYALHMCGNTRCVNPSSSIGTRRKRTCGTLYVMGAPPVARGMSTLS